MCPPRRLALLGRNTLVGQVFGDRSERRPTFPHGSDFPDYRLLGWVPDECDSVPHYVEAIRNRPDTLTVRPFDGHGRPRPLAGQVPFHLGGAG